MSWEKEVEELKRRQKLAEAMGGPDKLKRQKDGGKLNVRERIAALVDKGSFREIGKLGGVGQYDAKGNLTGFLPANILAARLSPEPMISRCAAVQPMPRCTANSFSARKWRTAWACP